MRSRHKYLIFHDFLAKEPCALFGYPAARISRHSPEMRLIGLAKSRQTNRVAPVELKFEKRQLFWNGGAMVRRWIILCSVSVAFVVLFVQVSRADCICPGAVIDEYSGGDGNPLSWLFRIYPMRPADFDRPPLICYFRSVSNQSTSEVRNVDWQIADYDRRIIPPGVSIPSCSQIQKRMSPSPANGPLFYAVSRNYPTTVRPPLNGWRDGRLEYPGLAVPEAYTQSQNEFTPIRFEPVPEFPTIQSEFKIYVTEDSWAEVTLNSSAKIKEENLTEYSYAFTNSGNAVISLLANIPVATSAANDISIAQHWIELPPGASKSFTSNVFQQPQLGKTATIVFYDQPTQKVLGIDLAGVYAPEGAKPLRTELDLRKRFQIQ